VTFTATGLPATLVWASLLASGCGEETQEPSMVRVHNASGRDFVDMSVDWRSYGSVGAGGYTGYVPVEEAYSIANVRTLIDGVEYSHYFLDLRGEHRLGPGFFTYEINLLEPGNPDRRQLSLDVLED